VASDAPILPALVVSRADVARLLRELESLEDYMHQALLRKTTEAEALQLPRMSRVLTELATSNKKDLLQSAERKELTVFVKGIHDHAPVVHMSFAVEPSASFLQKLIVWWRASIGPYVLLEVGLQPDIAVGCIVRTPNHQYDFSLREHFTKTRDVLVQKLESGLAA
jgi:F0F1-type ATP synthase delta subunit